MLTIATLLLWIVAGKGHNEQRGQLICTPCFKSRILQSFTLPSRSLRAFHRTCVVDPLRASGLVKEYWQGWNWTRSSENMGLDCTPCQGSHNYRPILGILRYSDVSTFCGNMFHHHPLPSSLGPLECNVSCAPFLRSVYKPMARMEQGVCNSYGLPHLWP